MRHDRRACRGSEGGIGDYKGTALISHPLCLRVYPAHPWSTIFSDCNILTFVFSLKCNDKHFLKRIGPSTFEQLFESVVQQLIDEGFLNLHMVAQDGSILEGNFDDKEGGWGWDHIKKEYVYGYKIHVIVDVNTELPVTLSVTRAGTHDSTQFPVLYNKMKSYKTRFPTRFYTADKAYDSSKIRKTLFRDNVTPIVKASKTRIKPRYPEKFLRKYVKRVSVERFFSRLKEFLDLKRLHIYGKNNVLIYSYIIITGMLLIGHINSMYGFSPRSVKTFLRKFT